MPKRPSRAPTSGGPSKSSSKPTNTPPVQLAKPRKEPPLAYIPCRTAGCEWEAGHESEHPCGKKLSGPNRPMTDAEAALVRACLSGQNVVEAQGAVLAERLDPELAEAWILAFNRETDARQRRVALWERIVVALGEVPTSGVGLDGSPIMARSHGAVYQRLSEEAERRRAEGDEQTRKMDVARTPPHATEFRETQRAVAGADDRAATTQKAFEAQARDLRGVTQMFNAEEIAAQDALERKHQAHCATDLTGAAKTQAAALY